MALTLINISILCLAFIGIVGTLLTRNYAIRDRTLMILSAAEHRDIAQFIAQSEASRAARHETFQLFEHALVVVGLVMWALDMNHLTLWRNVLLFVVSILMSTNSYLDLYSRRRLLKQVREWSTSPAVFPHYAAPAEQTVNPPEGQPP